MEWWSDGMILSMSDMIQCLNLSFVWSASSIECVKEWIHTWTSWWQTIRMCVVFGRWRHSSRTGTAVILDYSVTRGNRSLFRHTGQRSFSSAAPSEQRTQRFFLGGKKVFARQLTIGKILSVTQSRIPPASKRRNKHRCDWIFLQMSIVMPSRAWRAMSCRTMAHIFLGTPSTDPLDIEPWIWRCRER